MRNKSSVGTFSRRVPVSQRVPAKNRNTRKAELFGVGIGFRRQLLRDFCIYPARPKSRHCCNGTTMVVESLVSDEDPSFTNCFIFKRRLLVNFDCTAMWVKRSEFLVDALSVTPEILRSKEYSSNQVSDFRDWQVRPRAGGRVTVFRLCFRGALSFGHGLPGAVHDAQEKEQKLRTS